MGYGDRATRWGVFVRMYLGTGVKRIEVLWWITEASAWFWICCSDTICLQITGKITVAVVMMD
jgi:hypothetical protein